MRFIKLFSILSAFLVSTSMVYSQNGISNKLTKAHLLVRGTKVSIIPPKDFTNAPNFLGFEHNPSGSTLMVLDIPGPFSETSKGLTKEKLLANGMEVKQIETMTFNGMPALFVTGEQKSAGVLLTKYVLAFGIDKETYLINGAVPKYNTQLALEVKKSIQSAVFNSMVNINPFESIDYTIDMAKGNLKLAKRVSTSLVFTADGKFPTKAPEKTTFIASKTFSKIAVGDRKTFCIKRLNQTPMTIEKNSLPTPISVDGLQGFETIVEAKAKSSERLEKVYQVILFSDTFYYIFVGSTSDKTDKSITALKQVVQTFKRKSGK
jgi:hypothetical protein